MGAGCSAGIPPYMTLDVVVVVVVVEHAFIGIAGWNIGCATILGTGCITIGCAMGIMGCATGIIGCAMGIMGVA